ncbi:hypothetical protein SEA_NICEHOUSE_151 [Rhodococcus phage NiceHouse]|nr:hypothetical protein SEA_NICEHOUSE_151 [Rhodococcus phage NiceHouse]
MSILDELQSLVADAEQQKQREKLMLNMFELAGYVLDNPAPHNPDDNTDYENELLTDEDPECFTPIPKTLIELLSEALGNPPTEPGSWIRIQDIPRYISENLVVPERETLDKFNSSVPEQTTRQERPAVALPQGFRSTSKQFNEAEDTEDQQWYIDDLDRIWQRIKNDAWTLRGEEDDPGGYLNIDVQFPVTLLLKGSPGVPVRNRNPVL